MQSTAAKLSALIAVTDWGYGAGYARAWPYRYGTYGVGSGAPSTYTEASNYTEGTMILDLLDTPTNKLVFRGTGTAVIGGPESNVDKIRDAVKKRVAALSSAATRGVPRHRACRFATFPREFFPSGFQRNPFLRGGEHADRTPVARNDCKPCGRYRRSVLYSCGFAGFTEERP